MSTDPIDLPSAMERIGGELEFLRELLEIFDKDFREKLGLLREAVNGADFGRMREIGHALKGASANLSLLPLQEECRKMEEAGQNRRLDTAKGGLARMEEEFARLQAFLPGIFP